MSRARSSTAARLAVAAAALALVISGCGKGEQGAQGGEGGVLVGEAPAAGDSSQRFQLPLPEGTEAEPASTASSGEAYRVPSKFSLADVNAFYVEQVDNKPLAGFDWCGGVPYSENQVLRIWQKPTGGQLKLELTGDPKGVLVALAQDDAAPVTVCPPPSSPNADQPFEGETP